MHKKDFHTDVEVVLIGQNHFIWSVSEHLIGVWGCEKRNKTDSFKTNTYSLYMRKGKKGSETVSWSVQD